VRDYNRSRKASRFHYSVVLALSDTFLHLMAGKLIISPVGVRRISFASCQMKKTMRTITRRSLNLKRWIM
jgi:hypothetical protein